MLVLLNLLIKIAILILAGFLMKKHAVISEDAEKSLSTMLITVILPCSIIAAAENALSEEYIRVIICGAVFGVIYYGSMALFMLAAQKWMPASNQRSRVFCSTVTYGNVGFLGLPLLLELYGQNGVIFAVIVNFLFDLSFFTIGVSQLSAAHQPSVHETLLNARNIPLAAAFCVFLLQIRLPNAVQETAEMIGDMLVPLSMIVIGCSLSGRSLRKLLTDRSSYLISVIRLLVIPGVVLFITWLLKLDKDLITMCTLLAGMPAASLNAIAARQYGCDPDFASGVVIQSTLFSGATLTIFLYLCNLL